MTVRCVTYASREARSHMITLSSSRHELAMLACTPLMERHRLLDVTTTYFTSIAHRVAHQPYSKLPLSKLLLSESFHLLPYPFISRPPTLAPKSSPWTPCQNLPLYSIPALHSSSSSNCSAGVSPSWTCLAPANPLLSFVPGPTSRHNYSRAVPPHCSHTETSGCGSRAATIRATVHNSRESMSRGLKG